MNRFILFVLSFSLSNHAIARDYTQITYEKICEGQGLPLETKSSKEICQIVVKSDVCKNVPEKDLLKCDEVESIGITNYWDYTLGCTNGAFNYVGDTLNFIWEVMKWAGLNAVSSEARTESIDSASELMSSSKLFLLSEYEKARAEAKPPLQEAKALHMMGNSIGKLIYDKVSHQVSSQYQEMGCLNAWARNEKLCQLYSEVFIPPAAMIAFLKNGPKAAEEFSNLKALVPSPEAKFTALLAKYPALGRSYSMIDDPPTSELITNIDEIPFEMSNKFRPVKSDAMIERAKELEPEMKNSIVAAYNALNDSKQLKMYYRGLFEEAAEWMAKKGRPEDLQTLKEGKVNLHAISVVVTQRLKSKGDDRFTTIINKKLKTGKADIKLQNPDNENEVFRNAIQGPFFDRAFNNFSRYEHGSVSHLIQRDIVHNAIAKETKGNPQKFYDFLGTKKGVNWWADLFDSGDTYSMTRPEVVTQFVHHKMLLSK